MRGAYVVLPVLDDGGADARARGRERLFLLLAYARHAHDERHALDHKGGLPEPNPIAIGEDLRLGANLLVAAGFEIVDAALGFEILNRQLLRRVDRELSVSARQRGVIRQNDVGGALLPADAEFGLICEREMPRTGIVFVAAGDSDAPHEERRESGPAVTNQSAPSAVFAAPRRKVLLTP